MLRVDPAGKPPTPLEDKLEYVKFSSLAWTHDNKGIFYNRFPDPASRPADLGTETDKNTNQLLCYHVLGTPQSSDPVIWAMPDHPTWMCGAGLTDDGSAGNASNAASSASSAAVAVGGSREGGWRRSDATLWRQLA
ncbi:Prolyl endopeptidase [Tetrabaena socialis]|uniref:Prolyl endopeptidase n=1 Tax=Tetrabaena socialis TaxID=47790 RepID=A0A2J8AGW3_9CHLO|nr:Prolyl endopeptidase [Tetrabaena socialis]|eukprot:PNH11760.1 Prolyl endopeptidase [Tetrabaena socialis]